MSVVGLDRFSRPFSRHYSSLTEPVADVVLALVDARIAALRLILQSFKTTHNVFGADHAASRFVSDDHMVGEADECAAF